MALVFTLVCACFYITEAAPATMNSMQWPKQATSAQQWFPDLKHDDDPPTQMTQSCYTLPVPPFATIKVCEVTDTSCGFVYASIVDIVGVYVEICPDPNTKEGQLLDMKSLYYGQWNFLYSGTPKYGQP